MSRIVSIFMACAWLALIALHAGSARAETPMAAGVAEALFKQARADMRRGDTAAACPRFAESERIDPSNGTLLNLVLCEEKLGKVASAWLHARQLVDRLPAGDPRLTIAQRRVEALVGRVPKLRVQRSPSAPPGSDIELDGVAISDSSLGIELPIDPGSHHITVKAPGRNDVTTELTIEEAQAYQHVAEPGAPMEAAAPPVVQAPVVETPVPAPIARPVRVEASGLVQPRSHAPRPPEREPESPLRWLGWTSVGVGAAALVVSSVLGVMVLDRKSEVEARCPSKLCANQAELEAVEDVAAEGKRLQTGALVALGVGVAGVGFGAFALTRDHATAPTSARAAPLAVRSGSILTYTAKF
jgi:hypothetical protein